MRPAAPVLAAFLAFPAGAGVRVQRVLDWRSGFLALSGDRGAARG